MDVKFSAIVFPRLFPLPDLTSPFHFDDSTIVQEHTLESILDPKDNLHWREWLGTIFWDTVVKRESVILASWTVSDRADVIGDPEDMALSNKLHNIYNAFILTAPWRHSGGEAYTIAGKAIFADGKITLKNIRTVGRLTLWRHSAYFEDTDFFNWQVKNLKDPALLAAWKSNYNSIAHLIAGKSQLFLLALSQISFYEGCHQGLLDFRLPNFIRAIETVIALRKGLGPADFSSRTQKLLPHGYAFCFGVTTAQLDDILKDAYQLRSDCVHGKPFAETLQAKLGASFNTELPKYEYVIETCARLVLQSAFTNSKILAASGSRSSLESVWNGGTLP